MLSIQIFACLIGVLSGLQPTVGADPRLRLVGGRFFSEGYVQIISEEGWGNVCDLDRTTWNKLTGDRVCRHLGFAEGALLVSHGEADMGPLPAEFPTNTESFECEVGNDVGLEACNIKFRSGCPINDVVGVKCKPDSTSGCRQGAVAALGRCYKFNHEPKTFGDASNSCRAEESDLVEIEDPTENIVLQQIIDHLNISELWTGGIVSEILESQFKIWHGSQAQMSFDNNIDLSAATDIPRGVLLQMNRSGSELDWIAADLDSTFGFICEYEQENIGCLSEEDPTGMHYNGSGSRDLEGRECISWSDAAPHTDLALPSNWTHKFCRNPDEDEHPYCFVDTSGQPSYCSIQRCGAEYRSSPPPSISCPRAVSKLKTPAKTESCPMEEWLCSDGACISKDFVCDGEPDCVDSSDETGCRRLSSLFIKEEGYKLEGEVDSEQQEVIKASEEECAKLCLYKKFGKNGYCSSFSHRPGTNKKDERCILGTVYNSHMDSLVEKRAWNYFTLNTTEKKRRGIDSHAAQLQGVRLKGRNRNGEGHTVQLMFNGGWREVCSIGVTHTEADLICRQTGFPLGAKEIVRKTPNNSEMASVQGLKCNGDEKSIAECSVNKEESTCESTSLGIICREPMTICEDDQFHCKSGECVSINNLCDGLTEGGCKDGSDEDPLHCQSPLQVRLVEGEDFQSGRLEIRHKGVWGTVCEDHFSDAEASVFCRMLGYEGNSSWSEISTISKRDGSWPIWIRLPEDSPCNGNETSIVECHDNDLWEHKYACSHHEDVFLQCSDGEGQARSVNGNDDAMDSAPSNTLSPARQLVQNCGFRRKSRAPQTNENIPRIAGGQQAPHGSVPWQASVRLRGPNGLTFHHCGAVIVSPFHVLTTAHCLWDYRNKLDIYYIRVGDSILEVPDIGEQEFSLESVDFHPNFNVGPYLNNDIAVAHLKRGKTGIRFGDYVGPVCLPSPHLAYNSLNLTISGWGRNSYDQSKEGVNYVSKLQSASVPVIASADCKADSVYGQDKISSGMFCAGFLQGGVDSCQGDSGGPAVYMDSDRGVLAGLTSWGYGCGRQNKPGVYTRVSKYVTWIYEMVRRKQ